MLAVSGSALLRSRIGRAAREPQGAGDFAWPTMARRPLGRTGWDASRLVFGCGAALSREPRHELLEAAFEAGINVFDVGYRGYYRDAEKNLAPFLSRHRDDVFVISKSVPLRDVEPGQKLSAEECRELGVIWSRQLDESLRELGIDHVDAYYLMAANNTDLVGSDEFHAAFERAKQAGKVSHLGLSTHQNAQNVLDTAAKADVYSLAQIAITPAGWYSWVDKGIEKGTASMKDLGPVLTRAREAGIGLIGMKAGRYLAGRKFMGWGKPSAFDDYYSADFLASGLSPFQRSYAYVLGHGLDCVNADMQSLDHLQENVVAAVNSSKFFG